MRPQVSHHRARIQPLNGGNTIAFQELLAVLAATPIARNRAELSDHQALDVRPVGLVVVGIRAVVADLRIGQHNDLAGVGRVGEYLLVSSDGGIEDDLAIALAFGAAAFADEYSSIFQR